MKYTAFFPDVKPHLNADPSDPVVENAIKNAAIDFCKRSMIWREYPDAITVLTGIASYDLEPESNADITMVMTARIDGELLTPQRQDQLDEALPAWQKNTGRVRQFTQLDMSSITLAPVPDAPATLALALALQPKRTSSDLPDWIATQYWEGIAAGATSRLMLMNNKPWTDLATGIDKRSQFDAAIGDAKQAALHGLGRGVMRTTPQH